MTDAVARKAADLTILALGALVLAIATAHGWAKWVRNGE